MIIKIQQSLGGTNVLTSVFLYDETKEFMYETSNPEEVAPVVELLGDRPKAYFEAEIVNTKLVINNEVDTPDW